MIQKRMALPNPPKTIRMTHKLEDATRNFLNYLNYCISAKSGTMNEFKSWEFAIGDELCALRAHYNLIHERRKTCKQKKAK
jgi:hypothetical protein